MSKVKQITLDILTNDDVDGFKFAKYIEDVLNNNDLHVKDFYVVGSDFTEDLTDVYKKHYPEIFNENHIDENKQELRVIEIYGGMTGEYELILTDAPDDLIEELLKIINYLEECGLHCKSPYALIENSNYTVLIFSSHDDDIKENVHIDAKFDMCNYSYDGEDLR